MSYTVRDVQARLNALGYDAGVVDGLQGPKTKRAYRKAQSEMGRIFHPSGLHRVHMHWTGGAYGDIALERAHYHVIVLEDGKVVMGDLKPEANANTKDGQYAAHTRAANNGSIGIAVDAMGGAKESPFNHGKYPITKIQLKSLAVEVANLCDTYDIPVSRWSTLTHAEIQPTLGIRQRWKWDIDWIPGMDKPGDSIVVGDMIRNMIRKEL